MTRKVIKTDVSACCNDGGQTFTMMESVDHSAYAGTCNCGKGQVCIESVVIEKNWGDCSVCSRVGGYCGGSGEEGCGVF